jgi:HSP20 family protein
MANLIQRDPWAFPTVRVPSLVEDIDDLLAMGQSDTTGAFSISEDDNHIHIEAAVPGINPDDIEVTYDRGMVWIRGEAREEEKDKKRKFYRRAARAFSYRIAVPGDIDPNAQPEADIENGMVRITFSKSPSATPQKITVKRSKSNGERKAKSN